jgi:hypothetical protein
MTDEWDNCAAEVIDASSGGVGGKSSNFQISIRDIISATHLNLIDQRDQSIGIVAEWLWR